MIGTTLSNYRITAKIGEGGMGEVWQAEDEKLGRQVALKVLPELFAQDPDRLARFEREARVLASLSHPNVAGIFGLEEHEGRRFLVMELVDGETLAERLKRGALPVDEAVPIALQVALAVEAAHDKGVVHRDLKPGNVMVDAKGKVKVLDFGLAKAMAPDPISGAGDLRLSMSPTLTQAMTGAGVLLGTAGYMSPEQARGKEVDRRTDVWAFGCVFYEMLAGARAFDGETVTDVLGAIVHKEPELDRLPPGVPRRVRRLLEQCLQKDADRRLQSIGDARITLQEWLENPEAEPDRRAAGRPWLPWAIGAAAGAIGLAVGALFLAPSPPAEPPSRHLEVELASSPLFTARGAAAVLSPDGASVAYVTEDGSQLHLWLRPLGRLDSVEIATGAGPAAPHQPFFSPDGQWLGFLTERELRKVPVSGGTPITLAEVRVPRGASWGADGRIVLAPTSRGGLSLVAAAGGPMTSLTEVGEKDAESHRWPQWLPGGEAVLFTVVTREGEQRIEVVDVESGTRTVVHPSGVYARYVDTGHILFVDQGALFALPFDPKHLQATGSPMPVLQGIASEQEDGEAQFDVSVTGDLVYAPGSAERPTFTIAWADRTGRLEPLWDEPGFYGVPRLSPDGRRLAVSILREDNWDIWIYDLERGVPTRLTFSAAYDADPVWSPDGRWIAFASERDGAATIFRKRSDGAGEAERWAGAEKIGESVYPYSWAPDGKRLVVSIKDEDTGFDLWWLPLEEGSEPEPLLSSKANERSGKVSADGRWLAYTSDETGRPEVFVRSLAGNGKWQISDGLSFQPLWSRSGKELFFRSAEGLYAVDVQSGGEEFRAGRPHLLFGEPLGDAYGVTVPGYVFEDYDVSPDGQRFVLFPRRSFQDDTAKVRLFTDWFRELRRLTASFG